MKKSVFLILCLIAILGSCSDDDDDNDNVSVKLSVKGSDLTDVENNVATGKYYIEKIEYGSRYNIYIPYLEVSDKTACDAICPNNHAPTVYLGIFTEDETNFSCPSCHASFNSATGEPLNNEANNHKIRIYKYSYSKDKDSEIYNLVSE